MYAGATAGATALVLSGCDDDSNGDDMPGMVNVGSGSVGVLNYAYALEQLEAAFYTTLRTGTYYTGLAAGSAEKQILDDLYYHEVIHREFFKAALTRDAASSMIKSDLVPNFDGIDFNSRLTASGSTKLGVLNAAKAFEDLGVSAYNGAGRYLGTDNAGLNYLVAAGKIVSVEARHAALIRDLISEGSFVDSDVVAIGSTGLEISKTPTEVVTVANTFLKDGSKLNVSGLV
jgi:hypothetical protein